MKYLLILLKNHIIYSGKIINKWSQIYVPNKDAYREKILVFLQKHFKQQTKNYKTRLLSFTKTNLDKSIKRKGLIFFSIKKTTPTSVITFEKVDEKDEEIVKSFIKKRFLKEYWEEEKIYYFIPFNNVKLNKRKIAEDLLKMDYDSMPYKSPVLRKKIFAFSSGKKKKEEYKVSIQFFENGIKFLAYPSMKAIYEEKSFVDEILKNYKI